MFYYITLINIGLFKLGSCKYFIVKNKNFLKIRNSYESQ